MTGGFGRLTLPRSSLALIGLIWVLPFLQPHHNFPLTAFYSEWLAFALGLGAALLLVREASWRDPAVPLIALAPLGLVLLLGLQVALGQVPYPEQALTGALYLVWATLLMLLAHVLKRDPGLPAIAESIAWFSLVGGLLAALAGLLQHYRIAAPIDFLVAAKNSTVVYGNLGQPNHYAAHLSLATASAVYLYARGRLAGAIAAPCIAWMLVMVALTGSRSPWLYFGALIVLALLLRRRRRDAESRRLVIATVSLLPSFLLAQWTATLPLLRPESGAVVTSLQRLYASASGIAPRLQLASEAWQTFLGAPWLGAGWGQFSWHHFLQSPAEASLAPGVFNHAHNIVLQLMAETGLAGVVLIAGAALCWLWGLRRAVFDADTWWILALLAVIAIHSMLEYPLWYSYFLGPAAVLLGLGAMQTVRFNRARFARMAAAAAVALGWVYAVAIIFPYREFERLAFEERAVAAPADERPTVDGIMRIDREPLLRPYVELLLTFGLTVSPEDLRTKVELNGRVMRFAPIDVVVYRQALLLGLSGEREAARQQLERAARAFPEELDAVAAELVELVRRHPGEFTPLLELAAAKRAELRARGGAQ